MGVLGIKGLRVFSMCCKNLHIVIILWLSLENGRDFSLYLGFLSDIFCLPYFLTYFSLNRVILVGKDNNVLN